MSQCVWRKASRQQDEDSSLFTEGTDIVCLSKKKTLGAQIVTFSLFIMKTDGNFKAEHNLLSVCLLLRFTVFFLAVLLLHENIPQSLS